MNEYERLLQEAIKAGKNRDYKKAVNLLTRIVCNTDSLPAALLYLGRSYHALGQIERAVSLFEFYLKIKPESVAGNLFAGRAYLACGLYKKAVVKLKKVVKRKPEMYVAHSFIGLAFLKIRAPEIALTYLERAHVLAPENPSIFNGYLNALLVTAIKNYHRGRLEEARQMFEFILKHREKAFLAYLYLGRIYKEFGEYNLALKNYTRVCELEPEDPLLRLQKASLLLLQGKQEQALAEMKRYNLLSRFPAAGFTPAMIRQFTAYAYFQQKEYKKAIFHGRKVLKEDYKNHDIHAIVGEAYFELGDLEKARNHFMRCLEIQFTPEIHHAVLRILWEQEKYNLLLPQVKKMLQKNSEDKIAGYFYALALEHTGAPAEQVIQALQKQIKLSGPDHRLMSVLGRVYYRCNLPELAESWLLRTLKLVKTDEPTLLTLIDVYLALEKPREALKYYQQYYRFYPDKTEQKKKYINLLIREKKYKAAITELNLILPHEPDNRNLKRVLARCYISSGKYEEAIVLLKALLKLTPSALNLFQSLVYCLEMTRRRRIAINLIENARAYFKNAPSLLTTLGVLYFREKDYEKALSLFRDLLSHKPQDWKLYHNMSIIYARMGNSLFAEKFSKRALQYKQEQA